MSKIGIRDIEDQVHYFNETNPSKDNLYFVFHMNGCGHCVKLLKDIGARVDAKGLVDEKKFPLKNIIFIEARQMAKSLSDKIGGYPTIWRFSLDKNADRAAFIKMVRKEQEKKYLRRENQRARRQYMQDDYYYDNGDNVNGAVEENDVMPPPSPRARVRPPAKRAMSPPASPRPRGRPPAKRAFEPMEYNDDLLNHVNHD